MTTDIVHYTLEDKVAIIRMDDGKANALSVEMIDQLLAALTRAEAEASAVVLAGRPGRFCAGFDLRVMMSGPDQAKALLGRGSELLLRLYGLPLPLVIACSGHAMAGGALVVLTGDARFCADGEFKIGLNEVAIGLPVPVLAMEFARSRLSKRALTRATLFAHIYNPADAVAAGYLDAVFGGDELEAQALAAAKQFGALARSAFRATKLRLRGGVIADIRARMVEDMQTLMNPA